MELNQIIGLVLISPIATIVLGIIWIEIFVSPKKATDEESKVCTMLGFLTWLLLVGLYLFFF